MVSILEHLEHSSNNFHFFLKIHFTQTSFAVQYRKKITVLSIKLTLSFWGWGDSKNFLFRHFNFFHWNKKNQKNPKQTKAGISFYLHIMLRIWSPGDHAGGNTKGKLVDISSTQLLVSPVAYLQNKRYAYSISFCTAIFQANPTAHWKHLSQWRTSQHMQVTSHSGTVSNLVWKYSTSPHPSILFCGSLK